MKAFLEKTLGRKAARLLRRSGAEVVAVTGSVGKSSAKEAIATVLKDKFEAEPSPRNYNTEFGLPLAVLMLVSPGRSVWRWCVTLKKAGWRSWFGIKGYPRTWVLEMAADHPGDISKLVAIAPPHIGVVTAVGESHAVFFGSVENIAKEKGTLIASLPTDGTAVLNRDDERVWAMRDRTKASVVSFGFHPDADIRAVEDSVSYVCDPEGECGVHFKMSADGSTVPVFLPAVLGRPSIYAALAAAAVGRIKGMNLVEISERLKDYVAPPGRLRYIPGIKRTVLIDDTYNSAPKSALAALEVLEEIPLAEEERRFVVLGDMLELGSLSEEGHRKVGFRAVELGIDYLILVGERTIDTEKAAREAGAPEDRVFHFSTTEEAGRFVQEKLRRGDMVLIKGSRGMHMEAVVKELMADPLRAEELLVEVKESWKQ